MAKNNYWKSSSICFSISLMNWIVCCNSRAFTSLEESVEFIAALRISIALFLPYLPFKEEESIYAETVQVFSVQRAGWCRAANRKP